ncbi:UNVERIFIED_CONTAM: hypothetical protein Sangu_2778400 [Sesamum angustifolium]|uniref:Transposase-associated domain-containing protein n=1 Tax=Sesamum angustifolium TaxID=2727405 RepID=A0AAW2IUG5_9LAMI
MYEKNLQRRVCLTLEFEIGVIAFIEWVKSQHAYMEGDIIKCPCRKCKNEVLKTPNEWANKILPDDHTLPLNYYRTKKLIRDLSLHVEKIDACKNDCMLYWKDDIDLDYCKFCGESRYKPTMERYPNHKKTPYSSGLPSSIEVGCFKSDCRANDMARQPSDGGWIYVPSI